MIRSRPRSWSVANAREEVDSLVARREQLGAVGEGRAAIDGRVLAQTDVGRRRVVEDRRVRRGSSARVDDDPRGVCRPAVLAALRPDRRL